MDNVLKVKKKQTKKKLILVEKTPSPPKNKITKKKKTPSPPKKNTPKKKTPSPPKKKTPTPPKKTLKKKLKSPKAKTVKSTMMQPKMMEPTAKKPQPKKKKLLLDTDLKISPAESTVVIMKPRFNEAFVDLLGELADILQRQGEPFKARAYQQAQESIMTFPDDIYTADQLKGVKGIGKTIESKLEEYIKTGTLKLLEKERANPLNVLTRIYGIGPKKAKELIDKGITTLADLQANPALLNENQRIGLKYAAAIDTRIPRSEIDEYKKVLDETFAKVTPPGSSYEIVGSYRRGALTSGDIDLIITNQANNPAAFTNFLDQLVKDKVVIEILSKGKTKSLTIAQLPLRIVH